VSKSSAGGPAFCMRCYLLPNFRRNDNDWLERIWEEQAKWKNLKAGRDSILRATRVDV
jgi:hypothetical protein